MRVVRDERRGGAARESVLDEVHAAADADEQIAVGDATRVDLDAGHCVVPRTVMEPAERLDEAQLDRDHVSAPRATSRSSNGMRRSASSISVSAPLPAITTTSPARASA